MELSDVNQIIGRVKSVEGDKVFFFVIKRPCLGQIVKILSEDKIYYSRVVKAKSSSTLDLLDQMKETTSGREVLGPYSMYEEAESILFLEKSKDGIRSPTYIPRYKDIVAEIDMQDYDSLKLYREDDFKLGKLRSGTELLGDVGISQQAIPTHTLICGMTAIGKTIAELTLNGQVILNPSTSSLIFDFSGQLYDGRALEPQKGLKDLPGFKNLVNHYSVQKGLTIGLASLTPRHLQYILEEFSYPQFRLSRKLHDAFGSGWVPKILDKYDSDGYEGIREFTATFKKATVDALISKLNNLKYSNLYDEYSDTNICDNIKEAICNKRKSCLVDISGLSLGDQRTIVRLITRVVCEHYKNSFEKNYEYWKTLPSLLITLEEAHNFLDPRKDPKKPLSIFSQIALMYRKYRVGLCAVTPRPSRIDYDVFAELWTKIIMKTVLKKDRKHITDNTPFLEYSDIEIKQLGIGEALLLSQPKIQFAVPIKITPYAEWLEESHYYRENIQNILESELKDIKRQMDENDNGPILDGEEIDKQMAQHNALLKKYHEKQDFLRKNFPPKIIKNDKDIKDEKEDEKILY